MRITMLLILALISLELHAQQPQTLLLRVSEVLDGSNFKGTYKKKDGAITTGTFRLFGIAAPIKDEAKGIEQPYWENSRDKLGAIVGETVKAISRNVDGDEYWDIFWIEKNEMHINLEMVRFGHAWYQPDHGDFPAFEHAQQQARAAKKGLWGLPNPVAPWNYAQFLSEEPGASKLPANPTAAQTVEVLTRAASELDLVTLWDGLPQKYQRDIESMVRQYANSIDAQSWNDMTSLLQKTSKLVRDKKSFFLNSPNISYMLPNEGAEASKIWDAIAELLDVFASCSFTDQAAMKNFSMNIFLASDLPQMQAAFSNLSEVIETASKLQPELQQVEAVNAQEKEVTLKITRYGVTWEERWIEVDRRWLPADMIDDWDERMEQSRAIFAKFLKREYNGYSPLMFLDISIDKLRSANSQQVFDEAFSDALFKVFLISDRLLESTVE